MSRPKNVDGVFSSVSVERQNVELFVDIFGGEQSVSDAAKQKVASAGVCSGKGNSWSTDSRENGFEVILGNEMVDNFGDGGV